MTQAQKLLLHNKVKNFSALHIFSALGRSMFLYDGETWNLTARDAGGQGSAQSSVRASSGTWPQGRLRIRWVDNERQDATVMGVRD